MALEIQKGRSNWWYGRVTVNGRDVVKNLGIKIRGQVPASLREQGDLEFERTRAKAQVALEKLQLDLKQRASSEELVQTIHEIRTGSRVSSVPLSEAAPRWKALPRRRPLSPRYVDQAESCMNRFVTFLSEKHPAVREMADVQAAMTRSFFKLEEERGVSAKTYNNTLIFLRSCFDMLKDEAGIPKNPFAGIPTKEEDTIFRKPFNEEELAAIVEAAKSDEFVRPIIITAICTAMRRGDCCMLLKTAVDLPGRFIKVKTSKTGELVQIPIFPLLHEVLANVKESEGPYVFPEQAIKYQVNPDHITGRLQKVMRRAGFFDPDEAIDGDERKKARGGLHQTREKGLRKATIRDFHSFRVTWVTLALSAGVPLEIVQKVTGHRTASIVMKHYFQPGREDFRRTLAGKLPGIIVGKQDAKPLDLVEVRAAIQSMNQRNWKAVRAGLLKRLPAPPSKTVEVAVRKVPEAETVGAADTAG